MRKEDYEYVARRMREIDADRRAKGYMAFTDWRREDPSQFMARFLAERPDRDVKQSKQGD